MLALRKQFFSIKNEFADPVTAVRAAEFVCSLIPLIDDTPAAVIVIVPIIVTFGVSASHSKAHKLIPGGRVKFSVYVPGCKNIVELIPVPTAEAIAAAMVVKFAPVPEVLEATINLGACKSVVAAVELIVVVSPDCPFPFVIVMPVPPTSVLPVKVAIPSKTMKPG